MNNHEAILAAITIAIALVICFGLARRRYYNTKVVKLEKYLQTFETYFSPESISSNNYNWELARRQPEIRRLFLQAEIAPAYILHTEAVSNVGIATVSVPAWDNITLLDTQHIDANRMSFHRAIGHFEERRDETFTLVYTVEFLIFHPKKLVGLVGGNENGLVGIATNIGALPAEAAGIYALVRTIIEC